MTTASICSSRIVEKVADRARRLAGSRRFHIGLAIKVGDEVSASVTSNLCEGTLFVPLGCFAKLLTAEALFEAVARDWCTLDDEVCTINVGDRTKGGDRCIVLRHLVSHTHGLDVSVENGPAPLETLRSGSSVDLLRGQRCLARPGVLYNYGHIGHAAIVERLSSHSGHSVEALLSSSNALKDLWDANGGAVRPSSPLQGTVAEDVNVTLSSLCAFAWSAARRVRANQLSANEEKRPIRGWLPQERGIALGWKVFSDGWIGHNSNTGEVSSLVRVNLKRGIALVLSVAGLDVGAALRDGFESSVPSLTEFRPLSQKVTASQRLPLSICGSYRTPTGVANVTLSDDADGSLLLCNARTGEMTKLNRIARRRWLGLIGGRAGFVEILDDRRLDMPCMWTGHVLAPRVHGSIQMNAKQSGLSIGTARPPVEA